MTFSPDAATVYADGPSGSPDHPAKSEIRALLAQYETVMNAFTTGGGLVFTSLVTMNAAASAYSEPRIAWLFAGTSSGVYALNPSADTWTKVGRLPYDFVIGTDLGAGTANAIQITTDIPVSDGMIVAFSLFEATTSSPVTAYINGGSAITLKTNRGNNASALTANMEIWGRYRASDSTLRLLNDQDVSALVAQAEAAAAAAAAAAALLPSAGAAFTVPRMNAAANARENFDLTTPVAPSDTGQADGNFNYSFKAGSYTVAGLWANGPNAVNIAVAYASWAPTNITLSGSGDVKTLLPTVTSGSHLVDMTPTPVTVLSTDVYHAQIAAKANGYKFLRFRVMKDGVHYGTVVFDLTAGTYSADAAVYNAISMVAIGGGYYECSVQVTGVAGTFETTFYVYDNAGAASYAGDGTSSILVLASSVVQQKLVASTGQMVVRRRQFTSNLYVLTVYLTNGTFERVGSGAPLAWGTWDAAGDLSFAAWDSGVTRKMRDRMREECHLDEFSPDPTGNVDCTDAITKWLAEATARRVKAKAGAGKFAVSAKFPGLDGQNIEGEGSGFWRASPFGFLTPDGLDDPFTTNFILIGTGAKTEQRDHITACRQNGFHRLNPARNYNNANDEYFELLDMTNKDASGATRATLKSFSAGMVLGSSAEVCRPTRLRHFRIVTSCPGSGEGVAGLRGYADLNSIEPFADWDFGMIIDASAMTDIENVIVGGYYRMRGVLQSPAARGSVTDGQGEHIHWRRGYIQGGLAVRAGDNWPIIAKAASTIDVRWTASHRFPTSGTLVMSQGPDITYTGLTYVAGSPNVLRFTGCSSTASTTIGLAAIQTTANSGVSHSRFSDMYIADQGYATRIEGPNTALGSQATPFRSCVEYSGEPCRAPKLDNVTLVPGGPVAMHLGRVGQMEMWKCYTEPKGWKLTVGGADQEIGALLIAGPQAAFAAEIAPGDGAQLESWGRNFHKSINLRPLITPGTGYRLATMTDVFNPEYYWDSSKQLIVSLDTNGPDQGSAGNERYLFGLNGDNVGLRRRQADGTVTEVITGFGTSGNTRLAGSLVVKLAGGADLTGVLSATGGIESGTVTIADDAFASIPAPKLGGFVTVTCEGTTAGSAFPNGPASGIANYDVGSSLAGYKGSASGTLFDVVNGAVTGTTGTDTHVTVGQAAGAILIENRLGASNVFRYTFS